MEENNLIMETLKKNDILIIKVIGSLDAMMVPVFQEKIKLIFQKKHFKLLFDFSRLNYISSAGIGSLISAAKECEKNHGQVRLSGLKTEVLKVFRLLKFDLLFQIHADVHEALLEF